MPTRRLSRDDLPLLAVLAAALLLWAWVCAPVIAGTRTFYLRDVFTTHLPYKAFGAEQLRAGKIPAFNPTWGLGQPFRGNPNALPFYPGNILYLALPFWSAFGAHYALHWLLAMLTMYALARGLGIARLGGIDPAALLAGITWAGSGWMLSAMTFYNLLAVAAWWPLVLLGAVRGGRRGIALGAAAVALLTIVLLPIGVPVLPTSTAVRLHVTDARSDYEDEIGWPQLVDQVSRHVSPPPPPGTHPFDFLAAVASERRARDEHRLWREADLRWRLTRRQL